ncbi:hypothetical protein SAMN05444003_3101 [Cognatiyoonia sediminum]|uniref:Uncharacterized protein n=1 Tax=Cognatiyoonia sediminum TaxID=1508389 RepID=A0A1M5STH1_9RHOB|nr:hypothetical protein SAMN05444003_3101 [Cognatiyoonia sediminum]
MSSAGMMQPCYRALRYAGHCTDCTTDMARSANPQAPRYLSLAQPMPNMGSLSVARPSSAAIGPFMTRLPSGNRSCFKWGKI